MTIKFVTILILASISDSRAGMEGNVVGGDFAPIRSYPHSVFLGVSCVLTNTAMNWICGSSVLNQHFTLTAAHCLEDCTPSSHISIVVGNENRDDGYKSSGSRFKIHENYDTHTMKCDIALVRVKTPLPLNDKIKRVSIQSSTDFSETAFVAGWGVVDESLHTGTKVLQHVKQMLWTRKECSDVLGVIPVGCICAGARNGEYFASEGDSGSALVVRGYIQVGIVSYKIPSISSSLAVYTDVSFYYSWIRDNTRDMFCNYIRK